MTGITICMVFMTLCCFFSSGYLFYKLKHYDWTENDINGPAITFLLIGIFLVILILRINQLDKPDKNIPTPLDVYRGKTELKYTVVGNEITDSTVVFKTK